MTCLEEFCQRLRFSGYPVALAGRIVRSGILNYEKRLVREEAGGTRIHRPEEEGSGQRRVNKFCGKTKWFRKQGSNQQDQVEVTTPRSGGGTIGPNRSKLRKSASATTEPRVACPLFVPASKDGCLVRRLKEEETKLAEVTGWKYQVVERGGRQLRDLLTKSNLFSKEKCSRSYCMACRDMGKPFDCRRRGPVYITSCTECCDSQGKPRASYVGESARSMHERYNEHIDDADSELRNSHMYKHWTVHHQGTETRFKVEVIGFYKTALERQVAEGVMIDSSGAEKLLNSKAVYNRNKIPRITAVDDTEVENLGDRICTMEEAPTDDTEIGDVNGVILTGDNLKSPKKEEGEKKTWWTTYTGDIPNQKMRLRMMRVKTCLDFY